MVRVNGVPMKIVSYNVRGLGGGEKRVEVRRLVNDKKKTLCFMYSRVQDGGD